MHMGKYNLNFTCTVMGSELNIIAQEWDLEVTINSAIKMSAQCSAAKRKQPKYQVLLGAEQEAKQRTQLCHFVMSLSSYTVSSSSDTFRGMLHHVSLSILCLLLQRLEQNKKHLKTEEWPVISGTKTAVSTLSASQFYKSSLRLYPKLKETGSSMYLQINHSKKEADELHTQNQWALL